MGEPLPETPYLITLSPRNPPLLLDPDVGEIDTEVAGPEILQTIAITGVGFAEVHHGNRQIFVNDVSRLNDQFAAGFLVKGAIRLRIQLVDLLVAVLDHVEAAFILVAAEHGVLDEARVPTETKQCNVEAMVGCNRIDQRGELQRAGSGIDSDRSPGILHIGDQLITRWRAGWIDHLEGERLSILVDNAVAVAVGPPGLGKQCLG